MQITAIILCILVVIANIYATRLVLNEDGYETGQKTFQIVIIWLVPIAGAAFFSGVILAERRNEKPIIRSNSFDGVVVDFVDTPNHAFDGD